MANRPTTASQDVKRLMDEGHLAGEISARLGISLSATRKFITEIDPTYKPTLRKPMLPFGMTNESIVIRARLGSRLFDLFMNNRDKRKVCELVGINKAQFLRAIRRPYVHDWTISQMTRLHSALGQDLNFTELSKPYEFN